MHNPDLVELDAQKMEESQALLLDDMETEPEDKTINVSSNTNITYSTKDIDSISLAPGISLPLLKHLQEEFSFSCSYSL